MILGARDGKGSGNMTIEKKEKSTLLINLSVSRRLALATFWPFLANCDLHKFQLNCNG